jgi:hypothetical protein
VGTSYSGNFVAGAPCTIVYAYSTAFGDQTKFLCAAILNHALVEQPGNDEAKQFSQANSSLIEEEAQKISADPDLARAFSILYSFLLIRIGPKNPAKSTILTMQASNLDLFIRSAREICPTDNALKFLMFLDQYAESLFKK